MLRCDDLHPQDLKGSRRPGPWILLTGKEEAQQAHPDTSRTEPHVSRPFTSVAPGSVPTDEKPHFKQPRAVDCASELQGTGSGLRSGRLDLQPCWGSSGGSPRRHHMAATTEGSRRRPGARNREERARSVTHWEAAWVASGRASPSHVEGQERGERGGVPRPLTACPGDPGFPGKPISPGRPCQGEPQGNR